MPDKQEAKLIRRASRGDHQAITDLYEKHVDRIYRYIAYRVPEQDAEDLTAEVFVQMVKGLPDFEYTGAPFEAWLYRIASTRVADYHRQRSRASVQELPEDLSADGDLPEEMIVTEQEYRRLRRALRKLSDEDQQLLILRFVERRSHDDVATIMGKSLSAIRTAQHRALKRLAMLLSAGSKPRHYLRGDSSDDPSD